MKDVTRVEVIDHTKEGRFTEAYGKGRRLLVIGPVSDVKLDVSIQDEGRTLKVFVLDKENEIP